MKEKYVEDLQDIKDIMNRSSRFISLSGFAGISAGLIALIGTWVAHRFVFSQGDYLHTQQNTLTSETLMQLTAIAGLTLGLAIMCTLFFTMRQTKKRGQKIWDHQSRRLLISLAIPLVTGGVVCVFLLADGYIGMVLPLSLVFYGLSLVNASKYTLNEVRSLGLLEIVLGLLALYFIGLGLWFWSVGFGLLHIVYGIIVQRKHAL